jgi:hypothetical protein
MYTDIATHLLVKWTQVPYVVRCVVRVMQITDLVKTLNDQ